MQSSKDRLQQYIWPVDDPTSNSYHWQQAQYDLRCSDLRQKQQELLGKSFAPPAVAGRATIDYEAKPLFFAWNKNKSELETKLSGDTKNLDSFPKDPISIPDVGLTAWSEKPQNWQSEYNNRCMELKKAQRDLYEAHIKAVAGLPPIPRDYSPLFFAWKNNREFLNEKIASTYKAQRSEDLVVEHTKDQNDIEPDHPSNPETNRVSFLGDDHGNSTSSSQYIQQKPCQSSKFVSEYDSTFVWPSHSHPFTHHHSPPPQISLEHIGRGEMKSKDLIPHSSRPANETRTQQLSPQNSVPAGIIVVRDEDTPSFFAWAEKELQKAELPPTKKSVSRQSYSEYSENYVQWPLPPSEQIDRSSLNIFSEENPEPIESEYERNFKGKHPHSPDSVTQLGDVIQSKEKHVVSDGLKPFNFAWSLLEEDEATVATETGYRTVDSMQPVPDMTTPFQEEPVTDIGSSEYENRFSWPQEREPLIIRRAPPTQISLAHDFKRDSESSTKHRESVPSYEDGSGILSAAETRTPAGVQSRAPERSPNFYAWKPIAEPARSRTALITPAIVTEVCSTEYKERFTALPISPAPAPVSRDSMGPVLFGEGGFQGSTEYGSRFVKLEGSRSTTPTGQHQHHIVSLPHTNMDRYNEPLPPPPEVPKTGKKLYPTEQNQNFIWHQVPTRSAPIKNKTSVVIGTNYPTSHSTNSIRADTDSSVSSPVSTISHRDFSRAAPPPPPPLVIHQQDDRSSAIRSATSLSENTNRAIRFSESVISVDSLAAPVDPSLKTFPSSTIASNTTVSSHSSDRSSSSLSSVEVIPRAYSRGGEEDNKKALSTSFSSTTSTVPFVRGPSMYQNSDFAKRNVAFKVPGSPERGFVSKPVSGFGRSVSSPRSPLSASVGADSSISRTSSHSTVLKPANSPSNKTKIYASSSLSKDYNPILMHKRYPGTQQGRWTTESKDSFRWKKPTGVKLK